MRCDRGMNMNPDRKQRFVEAYSDALAAGVDRCTDRKQLIFGVEDIPAMVKVKLAAITKKPAKFEVENLVMEDTCQDLGIAQTREAVVAFLAGEDVKKPEDISNEEVIMNRWNALAAEGMAPEVIASLMNTEFPAYRFSSLQDEIIIETVV
jgi:hypothetical protein